MKNTKTEDIKKAIEKAIISEGGTSDAVQKIMEALDDKKILRYHRDTDVNLLSTSGRVLISLIQDPTMTMRAVSVYLDLSEPMIKKAIEGLISSGLLTKTKVNRQNVYRLNNKLIKEQPDIQHVLRAVETIKFSEQEEVGEQEPF